MEALNERNKIRDIIKSKYKKIMPYINAYKEITHNNELIDENIKYDISGWHIIIYKKHHKKKRKWIRISSFSEYGFWEGDISNIYLIDKLYLLLKMQTVIIPDAEHTDFHKALEEIDRIIGNI
jgi:hypothetical protein